MSIIYSLVTFPAKYLLLNKVKVIHFNGSFHESKLKSL